MSLDVYLIQGECEHCGRGETEVYHANITHNLGPMAREAGIYEVLWRPEERGIAFAKDLIVPLLDGVEKLNSNPEKFESLEPENRRGSYLGLVDFVLQYLRACRENPEAKVVVDR